MRAELVCSRPALSPHRSVSIGRSPTDGVSPPLRAVTVVAGNFTSSLLTSIYTQTLDSLPLTKIYI